MSDRPDIAALAAAAREVAAEWQVELGEPFALARYSYVAAAGDGAVRLLRRDRMRRALLVERARPGDDIAGLPDDEATAIAVEVGRRLWRPAAAPFRWIGDWVPRWLDNAKGHPLVPLARELYGSLDVGRDVLGRRHLEHGIVARRGDIRIAG